MNRTPWIARTFNLGLPAGWIYNVLERLHGTIPRILQLANGLSEQQLQLKLDNKWSIKEEIGHLLDLKDLHIHRVHDFMKRVEVLSAADMKNVKTESARHNETAFSDLVKRFESKRQNFIELLENLDDEIYDVQIPHPRLKIDMRPVDLAYFTAEHDDHHLVTMRAIRNKLYEMEETNI